MAKSALQGRPIVKGFFDKRTCSVQYVVADPETRHCVIIDPVLDFDEKSGATAAWSADALLDHVQQEGYALEWILDTHPHADHFSAAGYLKGKTGVRTAIGEKVVEVQKLWKKLYNYPDSFPADGSQWDKLFADGERFRIGNCDVEVMLTPGHTLASIAYVVGDAAFVHDTLFMPDFGTARADFPGGDARALWRSIQRILALPEQTRALHRARLHARPTRSGLGKHRPAAESGECSLEEGEERERIRCIAGSTRPGAADAKTHSAFSSGQHSRWPTARTGKQWTTLPQDPAGCPRRRSLGLDELGAFKAERLLPKLHTRVRFPSPLQFFKRLAPVGG